MNSNTNHPLRCRCGTLRGYVGQPDKAMGRGVCYCKDCQAFAHFLGKPGEILDELGGTDVVAIHPKYVNITQGREALACVSLSDKGLLRWYAGCCNTPIGNTSRSHKTAYVGLVHNCLDDPAQTLDGSFGPVRMWLNTKSAKGKPKSAPSGMLATTVRLVGSLIGARLSGSYKTTPFFDIERGMPVATPKVLTRSERERLMSVV